MDGAERIGFVLQKSNLSLFFQLGGGATALGSGAVIVPISRELFQAWLTVIQLSEHVTTKFFDAP